MVMAARGILFADANVLYDDSLWLRWLLSQVRRECPTGTLQALTHCWDACAAPFYRGESPFADVLCEAIRNMGANSLLCAELAVAAAGHRARLAAERRPFPGVVAAIRRLAAQGFTLGLSCNCEQRSPMLRQQLAGLGLDQFTVVVSSAETGCARPEPAAFLRALAQMELPAEDVVYVGVDPADLAAAEQAGLRTVACTAGTPERPCLATLGELHQWITYRWPLARTG